MIRGSWKKNFPVRNVGDATQAQTTAIATMTVQEQARIQAASRYQPPKRPLVVSSNDVALLQGGDKSEEGMFFVFFWSRIILS